MSEYKWVLFMEKEENGERTIHQVLCNSCTQGKLPSGEAVLFFNLGKNITVNETGYQIEEVKNVSD